MNSIFSYYSDEVRTQYLGRTMTWGTGYEHTQQFGHGEPLRCVRCTLGYRAVVATFARVCAACAKINLKRVTFVCLVFVFDVFFFAFFARLLHF